MAGLSHSSHTGRAHEYVQHHLLLLLVVVCYMLLHAGVTPFFNRLATVQLSKVISAGVEKVEDATFRDRQVRCWWLDL
jgi:hypothetical protein